MQTTVSGTRSTTKENNTRDKKNMRKRPICYYRSSLCPVEFVIVTASKGHECPQEMEVDISLPYKINIRS